MHRDERTPTQKIKQELDKIEESLEDIDFQDKWNRLFYRPPGVVHPSEQKTRELWDRIAHGWDLDIVKPKVDLTEGIGGSTLESLTGKGAAGIAIAFIGFPLVTWAEWGVITLFCMRYQPVGKVLQFPFIPQTWKKAHNHLMKSADTSFTSFAIRTRNIPLLNRAIPAEITQRHGVGFLEGTLLYYLLLPFLLPLNLGIIEYSLAIWHNSGAIARRAIELERDFARRLEEELSARSAS